MFHKQTYNPWPVPSGQSQQEEEDDDDEVRQQLDGETLQNTQINAPQSCGLSYVLSPPPPPPPPDETSTLLSRESRGYRTSPFSGQATPRYHDAQFDSPRHRHSSRRGSFSTRLTRTPGDRISSSQRENLLSSKSSLIFDDRVWYNQFTSTDWVHDSIADAFRIKKLRSRRDMCGRLWALIDRAQGWIIVTIIGMATALVAYTIDVTEATIFDYKQGYCQRKWYYNKKKCCEGLRTCDQWKRWSYLASTGSPDSSFDYVAYIVWVVVLSSIAFWLTLQTRTTISSAVSLSTLDENLGASDDHDLPASQHEDVVKSGDFVNHHKTAPAQRPFTYYPAAGSGVAEVKVIMSGFILHGYLGVKTLCFKGIGLIFAVASGLSLGKEGPYVHLAACIGNVTCRLFSKYRDNDGKRREMISAAAAAGLAVAFGSPIAGVLFSLEEVSYYFPPKTMFRTFFCAIVAALSLKFFNPYGTGKIVLFEMRYVLDWKLFELIIFVFLGVLGGSLGALFIKASRFWAKSFRKIYVMKTHPGVEVILVAFVTGLVSYWNRYTRLPVAELLYELAAPCEAFVETGDTLCATRERIPSVILHLAIAFVMKALLTTVTFGIKVPAGIYVPSMVVGGLLGRIVGHGVQLLALRFPQSGIFAACPADGNPESCVVPGVYALVAAGATMCGVTRLSVTLAVILFELTGSLEHVLPFSLGVLAAKWTADALEPLSIYELLTDMNAYPYLDAKSRPLFSADLGDIASPLHPTGYVDLSQSPLVPACQLRDKLNYLQMAGELDGGVPLLRDGVLVGLIPAPDLEYALDGIEDEEHTLCHMDPHNHWLPSIDSSVSLTADNEARRNSVTRSPPPFGQQRQRRSDAFHPTDFTPYVDPAPVALDVSSPLDLVFDCFAKLGLRYVCVLSRGRFVGMVHKKAFVRYVKRETKAQH